MLDENKDERLSPSDTPQKKVTTKSAYIPPASKAREKAEKSRRRKVFG
jgi:hypothetical protein